MESPASSIGQAGPSTATVRPAASPISPTAPPTEDELSRINASLRTAKKRRASTKPHVRSTSQAGTGGGDADHHHNQHNREGSSSSSWFGSKRSKRLQIDTNEVLLPKTEEELAEVERLAYEAEREKAVEELRKRDQRIDVSVSGIEMERQQGLEQREEDGANGRDGQGPAKRRKEKVIVWDILFENQRGIYILGKAHFSSRSLFPADPSPFTVPSRPCRNVSTIHEAQLTESSDIARHQTHSASTNPETYDQSRNAPERSIKTVYSLETYQLPSPDWEWQTSWMVNMKPGTDEGGWKYNSLFKKDGWRAHAGKLGWGGWVRRREWVRMRMLTPGEGEDEEEGAQRERERGREEEEITQPHRALREVMAQGQGVDGVAKALARCSLDRKKLDTWKRWLDESAEDEKHALQEALQDEEAVSTLSRAFTFQSSLPPLLALFASHNISLSETDTPTSSVHLPTPSSPSSSTAPPTFPQTDKSPTANRNPMTARPARQDTPSTSPEPDIDD